MAVEPEEEVPSEEEQPPVDPTAGERPARQKGDRFREGDDPQQQLEEIEKAQQEVREGKSRKLIDSIEKSKQRLKNRLRRIRGLDDLGPPGETGEEVG
jgi:hypothetical protein